eukprot:5054530-Prymnesium_polylepis.1
MDDDGESIVHENGEGTPERNLLGLAFKDGKRLRTETLTKVRERVDEAHAKMRRVHDAAKSEAPPHGVA